MSDTIRHLGLLGDDEIILDEAALALSALDHEGVDYTPQRAVLKAVGARLATLGRGATQPSLQAGLLARIFHEEFGFSGDSDSYDAPLNGDMIRVIDRRSGLPVSLSILYVAAARRLGWAAEALNIPGHVLVSIGSDARAVIIDPFNGGAQVPPEKVEVLLALGRGNDDSLPIAKVVAMSNRATLVRLLINQALRAEKEGDAGRALVVYERITIIAPSNGQGWWDLARLQLAARQVDSARASLSNLLEMTRDSARRKQIKSLIGRLAGR